MVFFVILTAYGCSNSSGTGELEEVYSTGNPDAKEILTLDPEADIFQFKGVIYKAGIDWVEELTLTKGKQVGEIKTRNDINTDYEDEMSNKLPVGAKIFFTKERGDILIAESEGDIKRYLAIVEG
nr:hypothetical protein [Sporosarcina luteola]